MQKTIKFKKIDFNGTGKKINLVTLELELNNKNVFSCCGNVWNNKQTDIIMDGQCLDSILPFFKDDKLFLKIYRLWQLYHLNDLHAGTPKQEEALKNCNFKFTEYTQQYDYLKSINLYNDNGYIYGSSWLTHQIPADDLKIIKDLITG